MLLIAVSAGAQHYTSSIRAFTKVKQRNGKTKLKKEEVILETDTLYFSDNKVIITSEEKIIIDCEVTKENSEVKMWEGIDDYGLHVYVILFKTSAPMSALVNYGAFGVIYFLDNGENILQ